MAGKLLSYNYYIIESNQPNFKAFLDIKPEIAIKWAENISDKNNKIVIEILIE